MLVGTKLGTVGGCLDEILDETLYV
jgi:hypothetical protein